MFCRKCGKEIQKGWSNCPGCGIEIDKGLHKVNDYNDKKHPVRNIIAAVAILFAAFWVLVIIMAITDDGSAAEESMRKHQGAVSDSEKESLTDNTSETMTFSEYLESCTRISNTELARNPEMYDGKAVDENGNEVGNIISGDYGLVAGKYGNADFLGSKYIDAVLIVLDTEHE